MLEARLSATSRGEDIQRAFSRTVNRIWRVVFRFVETQEERQAGSSNSYTHQPQHLAAVPMVTTQKGRCRLLLYAGQLGRPAQN